MLRFMAVVIAVLLVAMGVSAYLLNASREQVGALNDDVDDLQSINKAYANAINTARVEREALDKLLKRQKEEAKRVHKNLEQQLQAIQLVEADACADAVVTDDRINILRQPVYLSLPDGAATTPSARSFDY